MSAAPQPSALARANQWLTTRPWGMWTTQTLVVFRREFLKLVRRRYWIYLLALAPVAVIVMHAVSDSNGCSLEEDGMILAGIVQFYYLRLAIFFGSMGIFTWLIKGEVAERSLHYYFLSPMRREILVIGKFLAGAGAAILVFSSAIALAYYAMYSHIDGLGPAHMSSSLGIREISAYMLVNALAWLGYGAVFLALSLLFRNPIIPAVIFMGWEAISTVLPSLLQMFSLSFYLKNLMPVEVPAEGPFALFTVVAEPVKPVVAVMGVVVLTIAVLAFACYRVRRLEVSYTTD